MNVILLILEVLVLLYPDLMRELVAPKVWKHWHICSTADSKLLFTMDFEGFFTMDFLQNSLNIILGKLVYLKLDLMRELIVLVSHEVQICICSTADSKLLFTMDFEGFFTMDFLQNLLTIILEELVLLMLDLIVSSAD